MGPRLGESSNLSNMSMMEWTINAQFIPVTGMEMEAGFSEKVTARFVLQRLLMIGGRGTCVLARIILIACNASSKDNSVYFDKVPRAKTNPRLRMDAIVWTRKLSFPLHVREE